jgi:hypothetical protein
MKDTMIRNTVQEKNNRRLQKCFGSLERPAEPEAVQNLMLEGVKKCKTLA